MYTTKIHAEVGDEAMHNNYGTEECFEEWVDLKLASFSVLYDNDEDTNTITTGYNNYYLP